MSESDNSSLVPSDEAIKLLRDFGGFLKETFGTVPQDLVGLLGGDWLKVRRAEHIVQILEKARARLEARRVKTPAPASLSITLPILVAAADESRDELQDIWARLLAAAADPARAQSFRLAFIDAAKRMDPLDAAVLQSLIEADGAVTGSSRNLLATNLGVSRDEFDVSILNLERLGFVVPTNPPNAALGAFGREFLRAVLDRP